MNDFSDTVAAIQPSMMESARGHSGYVYLPKWLYEALPAAYVSIGGLFILGAAYIGFSHWTMVGYLAMGLTCVFAGVNVYRIRRRVRSTR